MKIKILMEGDRFVERIGISTILRFANSNLVIDLAENYKD